MRRAKSRVRKITVTDELVDLFRKAIPAKQAIWRDIVRSKRMLTDEQHVAALAAVQAFNRAANVMPWERSPLAHNADDKALQDDLVSKLPPAEAKALRKWWDEAAR